MHLQRPISHAVVLVYCILKCSGQRSLQQQQLGVRQRMPADTATNGMHTVTEGRESLPLSRTSSPRRQDQPGVSFVITHTASTQTMYPNTGPDFDEIKSRPYVVESPAAPDVGVVCLVCCHVLRSVCWLGPC